MPVEVLMPALSPTMTKGNIVRWLKKEGDIVNAGDLIAEIETDKATMEVESVEDGVLSKILVNAGSQDVPVNTIIALILEEGEDAETITDLNLSSSEDVNQDIELITEKGSIAPKKIGNEVVNKSTISDVDTKDRVFISPVARRLASLNDIIISNIEGSGPRGRIVKNDIENIIDKKAELDQLSIDNKLSNNTDVLKPSSTNKIEITSIRKVIAERLTFSKRNVPHFYLTVDCNLDKLLILRQEMNLSLDTDKISVNDFIIFAVALALKKVPSANVSWQDDHILQFDTSDIAVAVSIPGGLITPIIRSAEKKSLLDISKEMKILYEKARLGKLKPEEFQGGSFSISNLGMYGIKQFDAIINTPQACILSVGVAEKRPVIINDSIQISTVMSCTLSVDHRVIDGVVGSEFLNEFKKYIDNPCLMLL